MSFEMTMAGFETAIRTFDTLVQEVRAKGEEFLQAEPVPTAFGGDDVGRRTGEVSRSAHEVFSATVSQISALLEQYQQNLVQVRDQFKDADESSEAQMLAMLRQLNAETITTGQDGTGKVTHTDLRQAEAREFAENSQVLDVGEEERGSGPSFGDTDDGAPSGAGSTPRQSGAQDGSFDLGSRNP